MKAKRSKCITTDKIETMYENKMNENIKGACMNK